MSQLFAASRDVQVSGSCLNERYTAFQVVAGNKVVESHLLAVTRDVKCLR